MSRIDCIANYEYLKFTLYRRKTLSKGKVHEYRKKK